MKRQMHTILLLAGMFFTTFSLCQASQFKSCPAAWVENASGSGSNAFEYTDSLDCWNFFSYETWNQVDFTFNGESYPNPANAYFWDFGDGATGIGQTVFHTYNLSTTDTVVVVLTTYSYDPASGDSCVAESSQSIVVGNGSGCTADYTYAVDSLNSLLYHFEDSSTGPVNEYLWDFGDSTFSALMNPDHVFAAPGVYLVCLTISSDSAGQLCTDTHCGEVFVDYSLTSGFTAILDTLSGLPNNYFFHDSSTGDPESWYWDFGDGQVSFDQNPVHQFDESGSYEVCLTVSRNFPGGNNFSNESCKTIETPAYFDLGGQVYLDNIPMNNFNGDTTVVDTAMAYLYRSYENTLIPADTQVVTSYGYYWFPQVRAGNYIVRVRLKNASLHYSEFLSTYHDHVISWKDATGIGLYDSSAYNLPVHLFPVQDIPPGPGALSGYVAYTGSSNPLITSLESTEVFLLDQNNVPIRSLSPDANGEFSFDQLPMGTYILLSETPGMNAVPLVLTIDESNPEISDIQLQVFEEILGVADLVPSPLMAGEIQPNPVGNYFSIKVTASRNSNVIFAIFNLMGQKIQERKEKIHVEEEVFSFDTRDLQPGLYVITISLPAQNRNTTRKFIK